MNCLRIKKINSIIFHKDYINSLSIFPSGNLISVSNDQSIIIYDIYFNIIQIIKNAHNYAIYNICIKDENIFATCSYDKSIKIWIKKNKDYFIKYLTIENAHNKSIYKIKFFSKEKLISCSDDKTIKIWEKNNTNKFQLITTLIHSDCIRSFLIFKNKNILISSGFNGITFWNLNNYENIIFLENAVCFMWNALKKLDKNRIIVGGYKGLIKIISISQKKIIKEINNEFWCYGIYVIKRKGIFLVGGTNININIYKNDNYECIQKIPINNNHYIYGFIEFNKNSIITYGDDKSLTILSFQ